MISTNALKTSVRLLNQNTYSKYFQFEIYGQKKKKRMPADHHLMSPLEKGASVNISGCSVSLTVACARQILLHFASASPGHVYGATTHFMANYRASYNSDQSAEMALNKMSF